MPHSEPGHRALEHIDAVMRHKPRRDDYALSAATACLAEFRDRLVAEQREAGLSAAQQKQLLHVNAVITVVLGIHFPLGQVPWDELDKARAWLVQAVDAEEATA